VVSLHTDRTLPLYGLRRGLNGTLPPAISVISAEEAPPAWHPRFSSSGKRYRYTFLARPDRCPRWRLYAWYRPVLRDLDAMAEAAQALIGEHDFAAFKSSDCTSRHSNRRIHAVEIATPEPGIVTLDIRGNAFLRNMVRIVAGTLAQVGERKMAPGQVAEILASRDRRQAGQTAPPHGLELMEVFYDGSRRYVPGGIAAKAPPDEV
jgi:tRNA pseudouridine38-40 synthase